MCSGLKSNRSDIRNYKHCLRYDLEVVSHDFPYQEPFYTLYCQEASKRDRDVNACGNAHPEDKVKAEGEPFALFPMSAHQRGGTRESDE